MECPRCKGGCVRPAELIVTGLDTLYMACPHCGPEPGLRKDVPYRSLGRTERKKCSFCGRRPLDLVMLDVLEILVENGLRDPSASLRDIGTPMIEIGYPLAYPPRLGRDDLIIVSDRIDRKAAREMVEVPEVKGTILGSGIPGVSGRKARSWKLLAGCDVRADVVQSLFGDLVIYKSQSEVHIEFSRKRAPKVRILEDVLLGRKVEHVVDGLCGPGTLGLICVLAGARHVVLNDIWLPAVENVMTNLMVNRESLGIKGIERLESPVIGVGDEPVLVGRASGACEIEVYHGDLLKLFSRADPADLCLIDPFPGAKTDDLERACRCCGRSVII